MTAAALAKLTALTFARILQTASADYQELPSILPNICYLAEYDGVRMSVVVLLQVGCRRERVEKS